MSDLETARMLLTMAQAGDRSGGVAGQTGTCGMMLPHGFLFGAVFVGTGASPVEAGKGYTRELF
ncbi:MAG: hypothetical protein HQL96_02720 [Magnetococcales bacterium]|nr:hypothetical protein [Magnetococcales bacterium]